MTNEDTAKQSLSSPQPKAEDEFEKVWNEIGAYIHNEQTGQRITFPYLKKEETIKVLKDYKSQILNKEVKDYMLNTWNEFSLTTESWKDTMFRCTDRYRCRLAIADTELAHIQKNSPYKHGLEIGQRQGYNKGVEDTEERLNQNPLSGLSDEKLAEAIYYHRRRDYGKDGDTREIYPFNELQQMEKDIYLEEARDFKKQLSKESSGKK